MSKADTKRIDTYDIAKGIGIVLVYLGHVAPNIYFRRFIYAFHMPLFFIISGMLLNVEKYSVKELIKSRVKSILVPAVTFILFSNLVGLTFSDSHKIGMPSVIWFLPVLFFAEILIFTSWKRIHSYICRIVVCIGLLIVGILLDIIHLQLPVSLNVIPLASAFLGFGNIFKNWIMKCSQQSIVRAMLGGAFILLAALYIEDYNNMHRGHIVFYGAGLVLAIAGTFSVLNLSNKIDVSSKSIKQVFIGLGKNSLIIYGIHLTIIRSINVPDFKGNVIMYFLMNAESILVIAIITCIINKYARFLLGRF